MAAAAGETWAIIVGAGAGDRLGADRPKAFVRFRGRTLLAASLAVFDDHPGIDGIVCVVPPGYEDRATLVVDDLLADKVSAAVAGGATRVLSVAEGLVAVPESAAFVLVHDAARPLVTSGVIDRVLAGLATGAETLRRDELVAVQTPQGFPRAVLAEALAADFDGATDCASLAEHIGRAVTVVEGDAGNFKITSPEDLARADPPS